jgi:hypothetical protein
MIAKTPARASLRGRPEGASTITARSASQTARPQERGTPSWRWSKGPSRLPDQGAGRRGSCPGVDHDVQARISDQVPPSFEEAAMTGRRPDDQITSVAQGVEGLQVDERRRPQVLEPSQDRRLRVRLDDREMDRDADGEQAARASPMPTSSTLGLEGSVALPKAGATPRSSRQPGVQDPSRLETSGPRSASERTLAAVERAFTEDATPPMLG